MKETHGKSMSNIYILNKNKCSLLFYNLFSEVLEYTHGIFHANVPTCPSKYM